MADFPASFDAPFDPLAYAVDDASTSAAASVGLVLDWRAYDAYGAGDAYAAVPRAGGGFGKAAALCIGSRQCQKARGESEADTGVMCPSFRVTRDDLHSTRGRATMLRAALDGDPA